MIQGGPSVLAIAKGKKLMPCTEDLRCIHAILRRHLRRRYAQPTPRRASVGRRGAPWRRRRALALAY